DANGNGRYFTAQTAPGGSYTVGSLAGTAEVWVSSSFDGYGNAGVANSTEQHLRNVVVGSNGSVTGANFEFIPWVTLTEHLVADTGSLPGQPFVWGQATDKWGYGDW